MGAWLWPLLIVSAAVIECSIFLQANSGLPDSSGTKMKKALSTFRTAIPGSHTIPDPLNIFSVNEWYILDAISEVLVRFDHETGKYIPSIAESWTFSGDELRMKIKPGLGFNDGTPLGIQDVVASFQRVVRRRTSTHYQIWEHIPACSPKNCPSIRAEGDNLVMKYTGSRESLFMFLSCPEAAVWSIEDTRHETFSPKKFSGFYYPSSIAKSGIDLKKNRHNVRTGQFPKAPDQVMVHNLSLADGLQAFHSKKIDALLVSQTPFKPFPFPLDDYQIHKTVPIALNYLLKMKVDDSAPFTQGFLEALWETQKSGDATVPAFGILPPGVEGALTKEEALSVLPIHSTASKIHIGVLMPFHSAEFAAIIKSAAEKTKLDIEIVSLSRESFFDALSNPSRASFDYLLSAYLASDKFPMTQLKLVAHHHLLPANDSDTMSRDQRVDLLKKVQNYMLMQQITIPLYYAPDLILAQDFVSLGKQSITDSELQLWRINEDISN